MRVLLPLTLGSFALGLDAYVIGGILPVIGHSLHTSSFAVGQLVTAFTLSYGLISPLLATMVVGRPARTVLLGALAVFTLGNLLSAISASFLLLLGSRLIAGLGAGVYAPMSVSAAAAMVPEHRRGRALAMITGSMALGAAAGVPLSLTLSDDMGWRAPLWLITTLGVVSMVGVAAFLRTDTPCSAPPLHARLRTLANRQVVSIAAVMLLISGTSIGLYTYVAVLLTATVHTTHLAGYLWVWGTGGLVGSLLVGRLVDAWGDTRTLVTVIIAVLGAALMFLSVGDNAAVTMILLFIWGAVGWGSLAPQQHRMLALRSVEGTVAVSLNASALYLGSAIGAGAGGALLGAGITVTVLAVLYGAVAVLAAVLNLIVTPSAPTVESRDDTAAMEAAVLGHCSRAARHR